MNPRPPFNIIRRSKYFRFPTVFGTAQDDIQFCSGLAIYPNDEETLHISYGVADCVSRVIRVPMSHVVKHMKFCI